MNRCFQAALAAAGFCAFGLQAGADEVRLPHGLTSFGAAQGTTLTATQLPAAALTMSQDTLGPAPITLSTSFGTATTPQDFAVSAALSAHVAVDAGYDVDLSQRFDNYDGAQSPLVSQSGFLNLASAGHYAGVTYMPDADLHVRLGVSDWSDRSDRLALQTAATGLPLGFDNGHSQSFVGGLNWGLANWVNLSFNAIHSVQQDLAGISSLASAGRATTDALDVSANLKFGNGWVTTASYAQGLSQLDQRAQGVQASAIDSQSYSIAIAKHGLFGDDAVGLAFSRPSTNLLDGSGFSAVSASGDLPPQFIAANRLPGQTQETDLQLGYVTSFLDGALALQANAAYEMNYQGQTGATSVAVLSRAKIKF